LFDTTASNGADPASFGVDFRHQNEPAFRRPTGVSFPSRFPELEFISRRRSKASRTPIRPDFILPEHGWNPLQRIDRISSIGARFVRRAMLHLRRCRRARKLCRIGLALAQPVARA
jgi:hypothetical protein